MSGRMGGHATPAGSPAHPGASGVERCQTGAPRKERRQRERRTRAGEGRVQLGVEPCDVLSSSLCSPAAHAGRKSYTEAAAQVEGTSFPTVIRQWVLMHHFQGLEESQILFAAPNQCQLTLPTSAWIRESLAPPCSAELVLLPPTGSEEETKNTF